MRAVHVVMLGASCLWLGGCVLQRGEVDGPWGSGVATAGPGRGPARAGAALREVPIDHVELRGRVALRTPEGPAEGQLFVEESSGRVMGLIGQFQGSSRDGGAVMVAPYLPARDLQRAREGERVVFTSAIASAPPSAGPESEPSMSAEEVVVCSGPEMGAWDEEAFPEEVELSVTEGSEPGMERVEVRIVATVVDNWGTERRVESLLHFEYDPERVFGEEAPATVR